MSDETAAVQANETPVATIDARPWPRYFARMIDTLVLSAVGTIVLIFPAAFIVPEWVDRFLALLDNGIGGSLLSNIIAFALVPVPAALLIARGQTPGKWLLGIRVRDAQGHRLRMGAALKRELMVWTRGVGLGVPVLTLIALFSSHSALTDDGITAWDKALGCQVQHAPRNLLWWARAVLGGVLVIGMNVYSYIGMFTS